MGAGASRHDELLRKTVADHDGVVFSTMGDGIAAAFTSASSAVAAAVEAQRRLEDESWPTGSPVRVRMGLHTGEAEVRNGGQLRLMGRVPRANRPRWPISLRRRLRCQRPGP